MTKNRYCGNCGQKLSKKKLHCKDCDLSIEEYTKPYYKIPLGLTIFLIIFYFLLIVINIIVIGYRAELSLYGLIVIYFGAHIFAIFLTYKAIQMKRKGMRECKHCKKEISLKAKYCIFCGKRPLQG